ncbi:MAG: hypothetical protein QM820_05985 [Minicystis sp.]
MNRVELRTTLPKNVAFALALAIGTTELAAASEREDVFDFLRQNVVGRTLTYAKSYVANEGRLEVRSKVSAMLTDLGRTESGFSYRTVTVVEQTLFELDENGAHTGVVRSEDRTMVSRCALRERRSAAEMQGICVSEVNTREDPTGGGSIISMRLEDDGLRYHLETANVEDWPVPGGTYVQAKGLWDGRYFMEKSMLHRESDYVVRYHDPTTLERIRDDPPVHFSEAEATLRAPTAKR